MAREFLEVAWHQPLKSLSLIHIFQSGSHCCRWLRCQSLGLSELTLADPG